MHTIMEKFHSKHLFKNIFPLQIATANNSLTTKMFIE